MVAISFESSLLSFSRNRRDKHMEVPEDEDFGLSGCFYPEETAPLRGRHSPESLKKQDLM